MLLCHPELAVETEAAVTVEAMETETEATIVLTKTIMTETTIREQIFNP
jgi:Zn-dependent peptidase ImmA (M78 family)